MISRYMNVLFHSILFYCLNLHTMLYGFELSSLWRYFRSSVRVLLCSASSTRVRMRRCRRRRLPRSSIIGPRSRCGPTTIHRRPLTARPRTRTPPPPPLTRPRNLQPSAFYCNQHVLSLVPSHRSQVAPIRNFTSCRRRRRWWKQSHYRCS